MSGRRRRLGLAALALTAACNRAPQLAPPPPEAAPPPAPSESAAGSEADASPPGAWPALVRDEEWSDAAKALDALSPAEKGRAEIKYVRARVALALGDGAGALPLLTGLEGQLPLLADDIAARRAQAESMVGPFEDAAAYYGSRQTPGNQLEAARAWERAKDVRHARAAADRVLAFDKKTRMQEAEARALRVRTAEHGGDAGDGDRTDARWLAVQGADLAAASDALEALAKLDPAHPLLAREWLQRAQVLADAGKTDDALHAIDLSGASPDAATVTNLERARAKGMVLYRARGRWLEANRVLTECAGTGGAGAAEDAFHAARALSRADRDDDAIHGYEDVERRFPRTTWAEQAAFLVPYLRMLHGEWKDCARGFEAYLKAHAGGHDAADAKRDGALCELLGGSPHPAFVTFERMVEDEPDPLFSYRMADMAALAALDGGDKTHALARWTDVVRSRPLSWPALVARARLAEAGAPVPPLIDPAEAGDPPPPLTITLPAPADLFHGLGLEADAETAVRERETAVTRGTGSRSSEALCATYGLLARARRRFQVAQTLPSALFAQAPGPRTRWAWECEYPSPYADEVAQAEKDESLPRGLLWAVMRQESGFDPDAISPARAVGILQLLPETAAPIAEELGLPHDDARLTSPPFAVKVGARALHKLLDRFHGSVPLAVAAYNGGADSVDRWASRAPGMKLDTFVERIPFKETREYVVRVMGNLARYQYLLGGEAAVTPLDLALPK
jgi:soluble lytic murein transglycosylase